MAVVEKKIWPEYWDRVASGKKKFEVRAADFDIKEGDTLVLREWDPTTQEYTGREIRKRVGYVFRSTPGDKFYPMMKEWVDTQGLQVISLEEE